MALNGLLIDYEFCTGCHSCEMACKVEKGLEVGEWGIKLATMGPWEIDKDVWDWNYIPCPTGRCDLCEDRVNEGRLPACVHHCQGLCMQYGSVEELSKKIDKPSMVLFVK